jgi:branched-chain amino acid transport system substrate-binding protein
MYGNDDVFTKSGYDNFKKALADLKIPVTTTETFAKGDVDFKAQLTKIKASNPDAIVLSALLAEGAPIMVQARQLGLNVPVIGGNGMNSVIFDLAALRQSLGRQSVGARQRDKGEPGLHRRLQEEVRRRSPSVRRAGVRRDTHAAQAIGKINLGSDPKRTAALRDALPNVSHTAPPARSSSSRRRAATASRPATTRSRRRSSPSRRVAST